MNTWEKWEYRIALNKSKLRRVFLSSLFLRPRVWARNQDSIPFPLVFFSGARDFPELYFSIQSFLHFSGCPTEIFVVSDGSITEKHSTLLVDSFPGLRVLSWGEVERAIADSRLLKFSQRHPLGKKLATLIHFHSLGPFLFSDSDILYFCRARQLFQNLPVTQNLFLEDFAPAFDLRILNESAIAHPPTNTGFLFLCQPAPWLETLNSINFKCIEEPLHHTEQTIVHLALKNSPARGLDRKSFIVDVADQFRYSDFYFSNSPALRHYVQPVRYKLWNLPLTYYLRIFLKNELHA